MLTLEETIELILKNQPEHDRKDILKMIQEKREELGPEVVNEESAAMIVARELGIDLHQMTPEARLKISEITEETRNIPQITAKVISIDPVRTFERKDGSEGRVTSLRIADDSGSIRLVLWDDHTRIVTDEQGVERGSVIQVRKAYVKKGYRDTLELNLGRIGGIRVLDDIDLDNVDLDLDDVEIAKIEDLEDKMYDLVLVVQVKRVFSLSTFTRKSDGGEGKVMSIIGADESGSIRIVFWDNDAEQMQDTKEGEIIKITGCYTRMGRNEDLEVHAGRSATIERDFDAEVDAVDITTASPKSEPLGHVDIADLEIGMWDVDIEGKVVKIFEPRTFDKEGSDGKVQNITIADKSGTTRVTFWNEDVDKISDLEIGDIVRVEHGYIKEGFRGGVELHVGRKAVIKINPEDSDSDLVGLDLAEVSTTPTTMAGRIMIEDIDDDKVGKTVELSGIVVWVSQSKPVYPACPNCRKKVEYKDEKWFCDECGDVDVPSYRMLYKIKIDDGSGTIRVTLFGEPGEKLLQMTADEAHELIARTGDSEKPIKQNAHKVMGKYIVILGRVSKYQDLYDITANRLEFIDPLAEIKRMKDSVQELLS